MNPAEWQRFLFHGGNPAANWQTRLVAAVALAGLLSAVSLSGAEWFVNPESGADSNSGAKAAPFKTAQLAVSRAKPGDTIHLLPEGAVYRQMIMLAGKTNLTIEGHGVTLTGADPLPADGWEIVAPGLHRRPLPRTRFDRHLLIRNGKANRMGRSPSVNAAFPAPEALRDGEFAWILQPDEKTGWLYVRGSTTGLEWSVRDAGLATGGTNRFITARNLHTRHALNDGFNIHGDCRELRCFNISGYENFDEGFSAHDTCQVWVTDGKFWGNDNAVADVNLCDSYYTRCEFRDSVSVEVLFSGGDHRLDDCRIIASGKVAFSLSSGGNPRTKEPGLGKCAVTKTEISSADQTPRPLRIAENNEATFKNCRLRGITVSNRGKVVATESTLDGVPWPTR